MISPTSLSRDAYLHVPPTCREIYHDTQLSTVRHRFVLICSSRLPSYVCYSLSSEYYSYAEQLSYRQLTDKPVRLIPVKFNVGNLQGLKARCGPRIL